ncbi:MAG: response regulator, partial [Inhella sp.]
MTEAAPPRLLLVDDDASSRLVAQAMLRQHGFAVDTAASGEAALTLLAGTADPLPDLILLDAVMPGLDGFQTCERIREMPGCEALPLVMLTVLDSDDAVDRAFQVGATDFVAKGTSWRLLAARLRHQLRAACTLRELARSRERLARAQDLARMGSLEWQPDEPHPRLSAEALRALGLPPLSLPRWVDLLVLPLLNLALALLVAGLVVLVAGFQPGQVLTLLVKGAFGSQAGIGYTLYYATTFVFTGLAVAVAFQGGLFNIGGEGQAMMGGLGAGLAALAWSAHLPAWAM